VLNLSGPLSSEVVGAIVKRSEPELLHCYELGLERNPNLQGRVSARFVIGRDGTVHETRNGGSDLPDSRVVACVLATYGKLRFPKPERNISTVQSPLLFTPD
jgi:Ca-activated chloride channel family protein